MTEYGTIKIPRDEYERHNERRKANGQSWAEYIDGQAPESAAAEVDYAEIERRCQRAISDELEMVR